MGFSVRSMYFGHWLQGLTFHSIQGDVITYPYQILLSHPGLGWLYVFSSFPPLPLRPLLQQLLPLTSKPFEGNLRYLAQRIYGSGEMYWMTFPWPWPKVTAVASINKNLRDKVRTTYKITTTWQLYCPSHSYYLIRFWRSSVGNCYFGKFSSKKFGSQGWLVR